MKAVEFFRRHPPVPILVTIALLVGVAWRYLPLSTTIRALFLIVAFVVSVALFYTTDDREEGGRDIPDSDWTYAKVVTVAAGLAICATLWFDARVPSVAGFLLVGYLAVAYQFRRSISTIPILYELVLLFALPLFAKFLTTGLFFRGGDVLRHIVFIEQMLDTGTVEALSSYEKYPGYHLLVGTIRELVGFSTYDAIVLAGLVTYSMLVPVVYLIAKGLSDDETLALGSAVAFALLLTPKPFVLAFFPQSFAVAMLFVSLYLNVALFTAVSAKTIRRYSAVVPLLAVAMATTHHLTFAIALVPLGILLTALLVQRGIVADGFWSTLSKASNVKDVYTFPFLVAAVVMFTYWLYTPSIFLTRLVGGLVTLFVLSGEGATGGGGSFLYGTELKVDHVELAIQWLHSPDGIYYSLLGALMLVAFYELVRNWEMYRKWFPLLASGLFLSGLLLPLPYPIPWLNRIRLVFVILAVFPIGVAVSRSFRANHRYARYAIAALVLVCLGVSAPLTTSVAPDVEGFHTDKPRAQIEFGEREYAELQSLSSFLDERATTNVTATQLTGTALSTTGYEDTKWDIEPREDGLQADSGLLIVREPWTDHKLVLSSGDEVRITDERFAATEVRRNKIYTNGGTSLFWSDGPFVGVFGAGDTSTENATSLDRAGIVP